MPADASDIAAGDRRARDGGPGLAGLGAGATYGLIIAVAVALAALSLLGPSTPSFDPWCWLVWGREILHGGLHTFGGSSWKPLPVIFTTVFALFGKAQPDLWLLVARAGMAVTVLMSGKLAARLTLWLHARSVAAAPANRSLAGRLTRLAPAALAGVVAMLAVALSGGWLSDSTLGYSEGLAVAAMLIAFERHIDGHHRQAFVCGFVTALDRPETWIIWAPYGLWLMWKDPGFRLAVVALALLCLVLWFVPQKWGGGSWTSGLTRAQHVRPSSNALKACPFCAEMKDAWNLGVFRIKVAAIAMIAGALALLGYHWRTRNRPAARLRLAPLQVRGLCLGVVLGAFGYLWWVLIAVETQLGFSGNNRYLTIGSAAIYIAGGMCFGGLAITLAELPQMWIPEGRERLQLAQRLALGTAVLAAIFMAIPNWVGSNFISLASFHHSMVYQAGLRRDYAALIKRVGPKTIENCGSGRIMTELFQVPMAAWDLDTRIGSIQTQPTSHTPPGPPWPNIIMQDADLGNAKPLPSTHTIDHWTAEGARYKVINTPEVRMFMDCRSQPNDPKVPHLS